MIDPSTTATRLGSASAGMPRAPRAVEDTMERHMNACIRGIAARAPSAASSCRSVPVSDPDALAPGVTAVDRYEIVELLGHGGMGTVWKAHDLRLRRLVALKTASSPYEHERRRFLREARLCSKIHHRNVVEIFDVGTTEAHVPYYTMEFVEGRNLATVMREEPVGLWSALLVLRQLASGLAHVHHVGVVHRDIKPANVMIDESMLSTTDIAVCKLVDFGLATSARASTDQTESGVHRLTQPGHVVGTPLYMSPEQICDEPTCHLSDIYSFGCLAYEVLTGRPPFEPGELGPLLRAQLFSDPAPMFPQGVPKVPAHVLEALQAIVSRCMAKDREARPSSMTEVKRSLAAIRLGLRP